MTNTNRGTLIIGSLAILVFIAFVLMPYLEHKQTRTGTETMDAAQVIDLEVQAQKEYEASGGKYE